MIRVGCEAKVLICTRAHMHVIYTLSALVKMRYRLCISGCIIYSISCKGEGLAHNCDAVNAASAVKSHPAQILTYVLGRSFLLLGRDI